MDRKCHSEKAANVDGYLTSTDVSSSVPALRMFLLDPNFPRQALLCF